MKNVYSSVAAVGVDVHSKFSTVTMRDGQGQVVRRERLDHRDRRRLRRQVSAWPREAPVVLEASFGWAWLADLLQEEGLRPGLSNCYKVEQLRKARGLVKTNRQDADLLSLLPLESDDWWRVWLSPPAVRDRREWMRHRAALVAIQTETKNRIWALFHRHGILHEFSDLFGVAGRRFQAQLCQTGVAGEVRLLPGAWAALRDLVKLLEHVRRQLAEITRSLRGSLERSQLAQLLDTIPGFGLILVHTVQAEIGLLERFRHHRALIRYSLLAPLSQDTGEESDGPPLGRHLGKRGNRTLKWAFLEAAHGAVRHGGKWRALYDAVTAGGAKDRNRGYIKVARELVKVVYVVWKKGVAYSEQPAARPGGRRPRGGWRGSGAEGVIMM